MREKKYFIIIFFLIYLLDLVVIPNQNPNLFSSFPLYLTLYY